jgi:hypothetical protein
MAYDRSHMQLTPQEIEDLRREMREDAAMMKEWLRQKREREREQAENSSFLLPTGDNNE